MSEITNYYKARIEALENANKELRDENTELTGFIFDLVSDDCPEDYKRVIKSEVFNKKVNQ